MVWSTLVGAGLGLLGASSQARAAQSAAQTSANANLQPYITVAMWKRTA